MADLDNLTVTIETTANDSDGALKSVIKNLKSLNKALGGLDTEKLKDVSNALRGIGGNADTSGIKKAASDIKKATGDIKKDLSGTEKMKTALDFGKNLATGSWKGAKAVIGGVAGSMKLLNNAFGLGHVTSGKFIKSLARIAGYRAIRTIISSITTGAAKGLQNLAHASTEANATLSQLSSGALTLQNAMGGALYSVIASIIGLLNSVISAAVSAINWISMLFAILGGKTTFKKATSATKEYGNALGGAAGGAKALKQELMGFDEINSLSPDTGGGGGGGGGGMLDYGSMFEETPVSESLKEMVDKADFTVLGESLANKINTALSKVNWDKIQEGAYKVANSLVTFINGFVGKIDADIIGDTIAGLINTGLTFINRLGYGVGWNLLGQKVKIAIMRAIGKIDPKAVGLAVTARINAAVEYLKGFLPTTGEEWSQLTDWIASCIDASVNAIDAAAIGEIVGRVITGALRMITSLGETGVTTNIASAIATAIKSAIENVSEDDIKTALRTVLEAAFDIAKITVNLLLEIGNTTIGKALTAFSFYKLIAPMLKAAGLSGYSTVGGALRLTAGVTMAIDTLAHIKDLVAGVQNGMSASDIGAKVADIISSALESAGFFIMNANPLLGAVLVGVGMGIKLIAGIELEDNAYEFEQISTVFGEAGTQAIASAKGIEELQNVFSELTGVNVDASAFDAILRAAGGLEGASPSVDEYRSSLINLLSAFADLNLAGEMNSVSQFVNELLTSLGSYETATTGAESATSTLESTATAVGEAVTGITESASAISGATDNMTTAATGATELADTMKATGEQASELSTKIISIPSDIVFNLTLNNYESVITQLDELKKQMTSVGSIDWFGIGNRAMTAFARGLKSVKMPKISVSWSTTSKTASLLGQSYTISIPTPKIKMYAKGGFPDTGELFVANENGRQEMVGRIGNKPAVANQDQIGDAIFKYMDAHEQQGGGMDYGAMANALVGAMRSAGLGALYLDGKMIKNSLNKEAQRSGKPILNY